MNGEQQREKRRSLAKRFQDPNDPTGQAFHALCNAGMNEQYFRDFLFSMLTTPYERKRKAFSGEDVKQLKAIARKLEQVADALRQFRILLSFSSVKDWPISLDDSVPVLRDFAACIRRSVEGPQKWREIQVYLAGDRIPVLVREITRVTGKPHYKELAVLFSAVYGEEIYEDTLKVAMARYRQKIKKLNESG